MATLLLAPVLGACVMLPIPYEDVNKAPSLAPHVPPDWHTAAGEFLVLSQYSVQRRASFFSDFRLFGPKSDPNAGQHFASQVEVTARLIKSTEIAAMEQAFSSQSGITWVWFVGYAGGGIENRRSSSDQLQKVCLVAPTGEQLAIQPSGNDWSAGAASGLSAVRRDAIIAALRAAGDSPFDRVDGPCGMTGRWAAPAEMRTRIVDFLGIVPGVAPAASSPRWSAIAGGPNVVPQNADFALFAEGRWRARELSSPPRYLLAADASRLREPLAEPTPADLAVLFPGLSAGIADGSQALDNLTVSRLCMVGRAGDVYLWEPTAKGWRQPMPVPPPQEWRTQALFRLGKADAEPRASLPECLPRTRVAWTDAQLTEAEEFLAAVAVSPTPMPVPTPRHPAADILASMLVVHEDRRAADATALLLMIPKPEAGIEPIPLFLLPGRTTAQLASILKSIDPGQITQALPGMQEVKSSPESLCILSPEGRLFTLAQRAGETWGDIKQDDFSAADAADALATLFPEAPRPSRIVSLRFCGLPQWQWRSDAGIKVREYLMRFKGGSVQSRNP